MMSSVKPKRILVNGEVVHYKRFWRRGRSLSQRMEQVVIESKLNLRDIAFKYSFDSYQNQNETMGPLYREHLADVIKGLRNTPRYVIAIEDSWKLPIETIRKIYQEDKEREKLGQLLDPDSIREFAMWYSGILKLSMADKF
ncbi:hypothetical protein [Leptospira stimsonii]|uniref:Uncharacterized protein n=1 Tax=Leptospira stimsonii TaxID=2202203 RepID=A0A8B3CZK2_9LEPT|nr:hypothetical protein [Leptospira stimsonii]RHX88910.1 hypothetical protein DLM78_01060 [Leptospira stimsonii]